MALATLCAPGEDNRFTNQRFDQFFVKKNLLIKFFQHLAEEYTGQPVTINSLLNNYKWPPTAIFYLPPFCK